MDQTHRTRFNRPLGATLKARRQEVGLRLTAVARALRIKKKYLALIEADDFDKLPHDVYILGFVRRYSRYLGLDESVAARKYRLARGEPSASSTSVKKLRLKSPIITTEWLLRLVALIIIAAVTAYVVNQVIVLTSPPKLELTQPSQDTVVAETQFNVAGQTEPDARVFVNGVEVVTEDDGSFNTQITLNQGLNIIEVRAIDRRNQETILTRNIVYQP